MAEKFTDTLAMQALTQAIDNHAGVIKQQRELSESRETLKSELSNLDSEIQALSHNIKSSSLPPGIKHTAAAIEEYSLSQADKLETLKQQQEEKTRRQRLYQTALQQIQLEAMTAKNQIKKARTTLAASYEHYILAADEVKRSLSLLRKVWATWGVAIGGVSIFDTTELLELITASPPTDKDIQAARDLMKITADE